MKRKPKLSNYIACLIVLVFTTVFFSCTEKVTLVDEKIIEDPGALQQVNCGSVEIPWLYVDGEALRSLTEKTYKNVPLYFSSRISNCSIESSGWFLRKGNRAGFREFDPGPQVRALPVANGCGKSLSLPDGAFISDFTLTKKQLKEIMDQESPWIILQPVTIKSNNEIFIKWKVWDTEGDPTRACSTAWQWPGNATGGGIFQQVKSPGIPPLELQPRNFFDFANPVPPYPAEML